MYSRTEAILPSRTVKTPRHGRPNRVTAREVHSATTWSPSATRLVADTSGAVPGRRASDHPTEGGVLAHPTGRQLSGVSAAIRTWAYDHMDDISAARATYDAAAHDG
jgi:hypothetical protein